MSPHELNSPKLRLCMERFISGEGRRVVSSVCFEGLDRIDNKPVYRNATILFSPASPSGLNGNRHLLAPFANISTGMFANRKRDMLAMFANVRIGLFVNRERDLLAMFTNVSTGMFANGERDLLAPFASRN